MSAYSTKYISREQMIQMILEAIFKLEDKELEDIAWEMFCDRGFSEYKIGESEDE